MAYALCCLDSPRHPFIKRATGKLMGQWTDNFWLKIELKTIDDMSGNIVYFASQLMETHVQVIGWRR